MKIKGQFNIEKSSLKVLLRYIYIYIYIFLFKVKFFNLALTIKTFLKSKII